MNVMEIITKNINVKVIEQHKGTEWIQMALNRDQLRTVVSMVMNLRVP
jgi:hypothetical protein